MVIYDSKAVGVYFAQVTVLVFVNFDFYVYQDVPANQAGLRVDHMPDAT